MENIKKQNTEAEFNFMDILWYLLSNWKWYVVALAACLCLAYNKYIHSNS